MGFLAQWIVVRETAGVAQGLFVVSPRLGHRHQRAQRSHVLVPQALLFDEHPALGEPGEEIPLVQVDAPPQRFQVASPAHRMVGAPHPQLVDDAPELVDIDPMVGLGVEADVLGGGLQVGLPAR